METYGMESLVLEDKDDLVVEDLQLPIPKARDIVLAANMGLKKNHFAQKIDRATNGAYFMMDENMKKVAVFKPVDEEDRDEQLTEGERAIREVAAFLLDLPKDGEEDGFGGVPPTTMVRCKKFKKEGDTMWTRGSLQKFIPNNRWYNQGDRSYKVFRIDDQFQKMTLMDIRYGNTDRHQDNILLDKEGNLIPIDHGECFPKTFHSYRLDWTTWEQSTLPYSLEMVKYVENLNFEKDMEILRANGIQLGEEAEFVFEVQHVLLNEGVLGGHVAKDIGHLMTKPFSGGTSDSLSEIVMQCSVFGDRKQTMKNIRARVKSALDFARCTRLERESVILGNRDFPSGASRGKAKIIHVESPMPKPEPKFDTNKPFTGSIVEHDHNLETNTHGQMQSSGSQPSKPVSRFKAQRRLLQSGNPAVPKDST